jgi:hypothetical protein
MKRALLSRSITCEPRGVIGRTFEQTGNEITTHGKVLDVVHDSLFIEWARYDGSNYCTLCLVADLVSGVTFNEARS